MWIAILCVYNILIPIFISAGDSLKQALDEQHSSVPETVAEPAPSTSSTRGRGRGGKKATKRSAKTVSACKAPTKPKAARRGGGGVSYDSETEKSTDMDEPESQGVVAAPSRHNKKSIE